MDRAFIEKVYLSMTGELVSPIPGVNNAFAEGEECSRLYESTYCACIRILERLGVKDDDEDLETIICCMQSIQKELCQRMFEYGAAFGFDRTPRNT